MNFGIIILKLSVILGIYVIFSYHFGPSINMAPASSSLYSHSLSAILFLYYFFLNLF